MSVADDALIHKLRARAQVEPRRPMWQGDKPGLHAPASSEAIAAAEVMLGFRLPTLLRRIYEDVADGGFGPAYGILPMASHYPEAGQHETVVEVRDKLAVDPRWPTRIVPLCDWGCANWSWLDCRAVNGSVVTLAGEAGFYEQAYDLRSWLTAWLSGADLLDEMFEPRTTTGINPFTRKPIEIKGRGAPRGRRWP
jgi:hypothetical protein